MISGRDATRTIYCEPDFTTARISPSKIIFCCGISTGIYWLQCLYCILNNSAEIRIFQKRKVADEGCSNNPILASDSSAVEPALLLLVSWPCAMCSVWLTHLTLLFRNHLLHVFPFLCVLAYLLHLSLTMSGISITVSLKPSI